MPRQPPPDHTAPEAVDGLRQRRRERGLPVSDDPTFLDAEGRTIYVGAAVDGGSMPDGRVDGILPGEDGGPPAVVVEWPEVPIPERFSCRPRNYRREGPGFECIEFWVCDDIEVRA